MKKKRSQLVSWSQSGHWLQPENTHGSTNMDQIRKPDQAQTCVTGSRSRYK